jgi:antitoxin component YwqK of YwqJK toxin-antitoxin module
LALVTPGGKDGQVLNKFIFLIIKAASYQSCFLFLRNNIKYMRFIFFLILSVMIFGCSEHATSKGEILRVKKEWLDSIIKKSDTSWVKPYRNNEFVTSVYYVDRKDSIVTQLMKDSAGTIRQINIAKYDQVRLFFAEYYANGQMKASLPLDSLGKNNGPGKYYYKNGQIKSEGVFSHGFYSGQWKNYDEKGNLLSTDEYGSNGQILKPANKN